MTNTQRKAYPLPSYWTVTDAKFWGTIPVSRAELDEGLVLLAPFWTMEGVFSVQSSFEDTFASTGVLSVTFEGPGRIVSRVLLAMDELYQMINNDEI